jgi:hypothetical protein
LPPKGAKGTARRSRNQIFLDCGGKRSATPLWKLGPQSKSGVAAALQTSLRFASAGCHRTPKSSRRTMILTYCITNRIIGGLSSARPKLQPQRAQRAQSKKEFFVFSAFSVVKSSFRLVSTLQRVCAFCAFLRQKLFVFSAFSAVKAS